MSERHCQIEGNVRAILIVVGARRDKILPRFESLVERKINRRRTEAVSRFNGVVIDQKKVLLRVSNSCTGRWACKTCKISVIQLVIDRTRRY